MHVNLSDECSSRKFENMYNCMVSTYNAYVCACLCVYVWGYHELWSYQDLLSIHKNFFWPFSSYFGEFLSFLIFFVAFRQAAWYGVTGQVLEGFRRPKQWGNSDLLSERCAQSTCVGYKFIFNDIHVYIHQNTYIHTCIHVKPYIQTDHTYARVIYIHTYIHTCIHKYPHIWIGPTCKVLTDGPGPDPVWSQARRSPQVWHNRPDAQKALGAHPRPHLDMTRYSCLRKRPCIKAARPLCAILIKYDMMTKVELEQPERSCKHTLPLSVSRCAHACVSVCSTYQKLHCLQKQNARTDFVCTWIPLGKCIWTEVRLVSQHTCIQEALKRTRRTGQRRCRRRNRCVDI